MLAAEIGKPVTVSGIVGIDFTAGANTAVQPERTRRVIDGFRPGVGNLRLPPIRKPLAEAGLQRMIIGVRLRVGYRDERVGRVAARIRQHDHARTPGCSRYCRRIATCRAQSWSAKAP